MTITELVQHGYKPHNDWERAQLGTSIVMSAMSYIEKDEKAWKVLARLLWELVGELGQYERTGNA